MIDLTREDQARKGIERLVEGYSEHEKLAVRITGTALEITTHDADFDNFGHGRPVLTIPWTRIHRQAVEAELAAHRRGGVKIDVRRQNDE